MQLERFMSSSGLRHAAGDDDGDELRGELSATICNISKIIKLANIRNA